MDYFSYKKNVLFAEDTDVNVLAKKYGTPLYIYSYRTMAEHFDKIKRAFSDIPSIICYSVKCCSNIALLSEMNKLGSGFDIVSGGELFRALEAGADPKKVVYAGVGKTKEEIKYAIDSGILMFNVESAEELKAINAVAKSMKKVADVAIRINPDVDPHTHHYISTGKKETKFGVDLVPARSLYLSAKKLKHVRVKGVDMHIGSQITEIEPFVQAVNKLAAFARELKASGIPLQYFDIGGGLGVIYNEEKPSTADAFAEAIKPIISDLNMTLILEPGRFIIGNAGILVAKVTYNKKGGKKHFVIVDAGMNDLIRPSLYGAYHKIIPVNVKKGKLQYCDVVGPICESSDFLGKDRHLPEMKEGDLLAVRTAGAYGMVMSSNYNSRTRAAEVMVDGAKHYLIRERETMKDLINGEKIVR